MSPNVPGPRKVEFLPLSQLIKGHNPKNPKAHDLPTLDQSVGRFGFVEPVVVDGRTNQVISGHGRSKTLASMEARGEARPEGIEEGPEGEWLVPTITGWSSRTDTEARAALIALNRTGELGGWVDDSLLEILDELAEYGDTGLEGVGYDADDIEDLEARLMELEGDDFHDDVRDESRATPKPKKPKKEHPIDLILSLSAGPAYTEGQVGKRMGWYPGVISTSYASAMNYYSKWPKGTHIVFMDNEWRGYDHARHMEGITAVHPKYATTRDLVTKEQAAKAGVKWYSVEETLEMAAEVAEHTDNVILIPKYDCLDKLPETIGGKRVVLGYSVPSSYGGTMLAPAMFKGRPVHLLGGPWEMQRGMLLQLAEDVVSLDNNNVLLMSTFGTINMRDGSMAKVDEVLGYTPQRSAFVALAISLSNIAQAVAEDFGLAIERQSEVIPEDTEAPNFEVKTHEDLTDLLLDGESNE